MFLIARRGSLVALGSILLLAACNDGGSKGGLQVNPLSSGTVIAEYEGGKITAGDVEKEVSGEIRKLNDEYVEAYKEAAQRSLMKKLLDAEAKKQNLKSGEELMMQMSQGEVSDEELNAFIKQNKLDKPITDPKTGKKQKVSADEVKRYLVSQKSRDKQQSFIQGLMANAKLKMKIESPREVLQDSDELPSLGAKKGAKVTVHEFSDFECPFCARGANIVKQIHSAYGDKVRLVFRHFPLDFHPNAKPAAVASHCAQKQGKFWDMHDKMFENQQSLNRESFQAWATQSGLNMDQFNSCIDDKDGSANKVVSAELDYASKLGVNSTPTFFVNGKKVAGALPFENFKSMIDEELAK